MKKLLGVALLMLSTAVLSDCSETKIDYETFLSIGQRPDVTDVNAFLGALPKGAMSLTTLAHTSLSLQKDGITPEWPGVIRGTADGKLIFRYVCNPQSELKSNIEVMRFDEKSQEFKFSSIHFTKDAEGLLKKTIQENPQECMSCHQASNGLTMTRPIWSSYPLWPGMYGSADDDLTPNIFRRSYAHDTFPSLIQPNEEKEYFEKFMTANKTNPCYAQSLPENFKEIYKADKRKERKETSKGRSNQKFSQTLGMLYAKSLVNKITKEETFNAQIPVIAKAVFGCGPNKNKDPDDEKSESGDLTASRKGHSGLLITALKNIGIKDLDFTISFHSNEDYDYVPGVLGGSSFSDHDLTFMSLVRTQLADKLTSLIPEIRKFSVVSRGIQEGYYKNDNKCIDDLGGRLVLTKNQRNDLCKILNARFPEGAPAPIFNTHAEISNDEAKKSPGFVKLIASCARCHAKGGDTLIPQFLLDQEKFLARLNSHDGFAERMMGRMGSVDMPMPPRGNLPVEDQNLINEFLKQFKK